MVEYEDKCLSVTVKTKSNMGIDKLAWELACKILQNNKNKAIIILIVYFSIERLERPYLIAI